VREKLGFLPAPSDAVGRTSQISGTATLTQAGTVVTIATSTFRVAVNTLKSNETMRDQHIQTIGLQSATYPTATFSQSTPLRLPAAALDGRVVRSPVTGLLTLHGTARAVTIPLQVRLSATRLQAAGSITFPWGEFHMTAPSVGGFVSVTAHATMEFDLQLTRTG
jgi:polyisoprenoid-binding protein YceI